MSWAVAFREQGWDVWITEHLSPKELTPDPENPGTTQQERFWRETVAEFGFAGRECLIVDGASPQLAAMREFAQGAELFLNYSGQFHLLPLVDGVKCKGYLDVDPAFTQIWSEVCGVNMNFAGHDRHFTVGLNLNGPTARLPKAGIDWVPVPPPMPAAYWRGRRARCAGPDAGGAWTTVGHWYGYHDLVWEERIYGGKRDSFLALTGLPKQVPVDCAVATDLEKAWDGGDYNRFLAAGWKFFAAAEACATVETYLQFIQTSRGEIGIAKGGYLASQCGWMSDRSLIYLALGRPVLLQETGWTQVLPAGEGILPFHDLESCAAAIRKVEADYENQSRAAVAFVEKWMAPKRVVGLIAEAADL